MTRHVLLVSVLLPKDSIVSEVRKFRKSQTVPITVMAFCKHYLEGQTLSRRHTGKKPCPDQTEGQTKFMVHRHEWNYLIIHFYKEDMTLWKESKFCAYAQERTKQG